MFPAANMEFYILVGLVELHCNIAMYRTADGVSAMQ